MKPIQKNVDWSKNPEIRWEKVLCPICGQKTGPDSKCYEVSVESSKTDPNGVISKTIEVGGDILPIFSTQCHFRKNNEYLFYSNYPLSVHLVGDLGSVEGVEKLIISSPYRGKIAIADQFDDRQVRKTIEEVYRSSINYVRSEEL
jgi:hypothetical protein